MQFLLLARNAFACVWLACLAAQAQAAQTHLDVLSIDLNSRIDRVAALPSRFAVDVPHTVSLTTNGEWSTAGGMSTWRYAVQIPSAISMSFHAASAQFPASAILKVSAGNTDYVYRAEDLRRGELWSRIGRGDTLSFELRVATQEQAALRLTIDSIQAGYRSFDGPTRDHPHYRALKSASAGTASAAASACTENWECHTTSVNTGPGQATVALIIGNVGQCSGVLLNDVPADGTPYVLTARHCENGQPGGGQPSAAANVTVYWDAVTPCTQPLGSIYSPGTPAQFGASTVVEQQDTWLIRLNQLPVVDDAYYSGWDATGATFIGGFTAHHGLGSTRQFVAWSGQADYETITGSALGVGFTSNVWGTVNGVGSVAPGASGSGVFDANGHLVGTLSRAALQGSDPSPGVCPVPSPPAPSPQNSTAQSTAFSAVFASTNDPTSTTGAATIQSVLDPGHTGAQVLDGQAQPPFVSLTTSAGSDPLTGNTLSIYWNSKRATTCTASGGTPGDGWAGPRALSGQASVTNYDGGSIQYVLNCGDGTRSVTQSVTVHWQLAVPAAQLVTSDGLPAYGTPFTLSWGSNVRPCVASGGLPGDGWSGTFTTVSTVSVTETTPGSVTFTITCGSGTRTATSQITVPVSAPFASIGADVIAPLRIGETAHLNTNTSGEPCTASGGSNSDGWAGTSIPGGQSPSAVFSVSETSPGTYTYVVTCGSGTHVATAQVALTFTSDAPLVTLTAAPNPAKAATVNLAAGDEVLLTWTANVRPCALAITGPLIVSPPAIEGLPHESTTVGSIYVGDVTYQVTCGSGPTLTQATTVVTYTGTPAVALLSPVNVIAGSQFTVNVNENVIQPCTATGGSAGDGWSGALTLTQQLKFLPMPSASVTVSETSPGTYTYTVTCGSGTQQISAQTTTTVLAGQPSVTMSASNQQPLINQPITISWNSNTAPCTSASGTGYDGWGGKSLQTAGTVTLTEPSAGSYFYQLRCGVPPLFADASVTVNFIAAAPPQLQASASSVLAGQHVRLSWSSSDGSTCNAGGGAAGDGWAGSLAASGSVDVRETGVTTYTYLLTCGAAPQVSTQVVFTSPPPAPQQTLPPTVSLTASASSITTGQSVTLTYTAANADSCTGTGGGAGDNWPSSTLNVSGATRTVTEATPGSYTYTITCTRTGFAAVTSSVTVAVNAQVIVSASPSEPKSSGGGGVIRVMDSLCLALLTLVRLTYGSRRRRRRGVTGACGNSRCRLSA